MVLGKKICGHVTVSTCQGCHDGPVLAYRTLLVRGHAIDSMCSLPGTDDECSGQRKQGLIRRPARELEMERDVDLCGIVRPTIGDGFRLRRDEWSQ